MDDPVVLVTKLDMEGAIKKPQWKDELRVKYSCLLEYFKFLNRNYNS